MKRDDYTRTSQEDQKALMALYDDTLVDTLFQPTVLAPRNHISEEFSTKTSGHPFALMIALLVVTLAMALSLHYLAGTHTPIHHETNPLKTLFHLPLVHLLLISTLGILSSALLFLIGLSFSIVSVLTRPKKDAPFRSLTPFTMDMPCEEIHFSPSQGNYQVNGLFIPRQGATATIIISPGYRRTYQDVLGICKHLWLAEYHVLAFEYYGHGSVVGVPITFGYREVNDFLGAVSYAKTRTPSTRLGAIGYSMGGAVTIMGSARAPEVEAVITDSTFATHRNAVERVIHRRLHISSHQLKSITRLLHWSVDQALWLRVGYRSHQVEPLQEISKIAPRPILLIHGLDDSIVDPADVQCLYQAAGKPKALWLLPNTEHIQAYLTDSSAYMARITEFFDYRLKGIHPKKSPHSEYRPTQHSLLRGPEKQSVKQPDQVVMRSLIGNIYAALISSISLIHRIFLVDRRRQIGQWMGKFSWHPQSQRMHLAPLPYITPFIASIFPKHSTAQHLLVMEAKEKGQQGAIEQTLLLLYAQILQVPKEHLKTTSDFFQLGGDANTLNELLFAINQRYHAHLTPESIFDHPVLFRLAAVVEKQWAAIQPDDMLSSL